MDSGKLNGIIKLIGEAKVHGFVQPIKSELYFSTFMAVPSLD